MDLLWMVMTHCYCVVCIIFLNILYGFGAALRDNPSHIGGSDDVKSLVVMVERVWYIVRLILVSKCIRWTLQ